MHRVAVSFCLNIYIYIFFLRKDDIYILGKVKSSSSDDYASEKNGTPIS